MNQKPVDDKELENIIKWRAMKGFSTWQFDQEHINELVEDLNAHYQKKYLGLIEKVRHSHYLTDDDVATYDEEGKPIIYLEDLLEALANLEGE